MTMTDNTLTGETFWSDTTIKHSGIRQNTAAAAALSLRSNVLAMTREAENAVLCPEDTGAWSHALRAALASRVAVQHKLPTLGSQYASMIDDARYSELANPANNGEALGLGHVVAFMDSVSVQPRDVVAADIQSLQQHGVSDADIVRLTELSAFLAYQLRLIAGLALLSEVVE